MAMMLHFSVRVWRREKTENSENQRVGVFFPYFHESKKEAELIHKTTSRADLHLL